MTKKRLNKYIIVINENVYAVQSPLKPKAFKKSFFAAQEDAYVRNLAEIKFGGTSIYNDFGCQDDTDIYTLDQYFRLLQSNT
jgi:hypothetical protein